MTESLPESCQCILEQGLAELDLQISTEQKSLLLDFITLLLKWNRAYNLTAIRDPEQMIVKHLLDSLSVSTYLSGEDILDVGTGPGIPGIPLAIIFPNRRFTLMDSNGKKVRFIHQALQSLGIKNVKAVQHRVEEFQSNEGFDSIISRAFTSLKQMVELCQHLLKEGGEFQAMKGLYPEPEQQPLGDEWTIENVEALKVPGLDEDRHLVFIRKVIE